MVINIVKTSLPLVPISKYTLEEKGTSRVSVSRTTDYRQITGITMARSFLPIQLIYHGKTPLSQPKYKFPKEFMLLRHWANAETSIAFLEHFLIPFIETQREEMDSSSPWLIISDIFKGQWTDRNCSTIQR